LVGDRDQPLQGFEWLEREPHAVVHNLPGPLRGLIVGPKPRGIRGDQVFGGAAGISGKVHAAPSLSALAGHRPGQRGAPHATLPTLDVGRLPNWTFAVRPWPARNGPVYS